MKLLPLANWTCLFMISGDKQKVYNENKWKLTPSVRSLWEKYFPLVSAIVFILDANDHKRIDEAAYELNRLLTNEYVKHIPILVLGNKIDKPYALSEPNLRKRLGLDQLTSGHHVFVFFHFLFHIFLKATLEELKANGTRPLELFMSSIVNNQGYPNGEKMMI